MNLRACLLCACAAAAAAAAGTAAAQSPAPTTYRAAYEILYKGRSAGESTFSVSSEATEGHYRFVSNSQLRGIVARIVAPRPVVENSLFTVANGRLQPVEFSYEDGSRKGEDNYRIGFDWSSGTATLTTANGPRAIPLEPGILDRGSSQVALMFDVALGAPPGTYRIIDDDGLEVYEVSSLGSGTTATALGEMETKGFAQQRVGSSRRTVFWTAPALAFLPVRIEQIRNGEAETVFVLQSVELD